MGPARALTWRCWGELPPSLWPRPIGGQWLGLRSLTWDSVWNGGPFGFEAARARAQASALALTPEQREWTFDLLTGQGRFNKVFSKNYDEPSPQIVKCLVVLEVLQTFPEPLNIVSDSIYVVNAVKLLEAAGIIKASSKVASVFRQIQITLQNRRTPMFITHIRAHSGLPGPMSLGNDLADRATRLAMTIFLSQLDTAKNFHQRFHVTAETLRRRFSITRQEARDIVINCKNCSQFLPTPHVGINPRGVRPLQVWQMDVTHVAAFGRLQYVHVSIDTCSGVIAATPLTGEKTSHVIQHCLEAWSAWGIPKALKTDNGPAYTSQKFQQFCNQMNVTHLTGLPYNPQGQGIVERAHRTIKSYLIKQKGGIETVPLTIPRVAISMALFTLNFLNLDNNGHNAAERHCMEPDRPKEMVKWKDVLRNEWKGPDPILIRSRGAVCVFPQNEDNPFWVPERLTRRILEPAKRTFEEDGINTCHTNTDDDPHDDRTTMGNNDNLPHPDAGTV